MNAVHDALDSMIFELPRINGTLYMWSLYEREMQTYVVAVSKTDVYVEVGPLVLHYVLHSAR